MPARVRAWSRVRVYPCVRAGTSARPVAAAEAATVMVTATVVQVQTRMEVEPVGRPAAPSASGTNMSQAIYSARIQGPCAPTDLPETRTRFRCTIRFCRARAHRFCCSRAHKQHTRPRTGRMRAARFADATRSCTSTTRSCMSTSQRQRSARHGRSLLACVDVLCCPRCDDCSRRFICWSACCCACDISQHAMFRNRCKGCEVCCSAHAALPDGPPPLPLAAPPALPVADP